MIVLPDANGDEGAEVRILLAECKTPAYAGYSIEAATECMQLMDAVLWNRRENPMPFLARGAKSLADIVKARGQFAGFEKYPDYDNRIRTRIADMLNIANSTKDSRSGAFIEHINLAIKIAKSVEFYDPSPGKLVAWRTARSASPGRAFLFYKRVLDNDFYYQ